MSALLPAGVQAAPKRGQQVALRSPSLSLAQQRLLDACAANTRCAVAFHLPPPSASASSASTVQAYDVKLFRHLLQRREAELGISSASQAPFSCVAGEAEPTQDCLDWWMVALQQAQFCAANERYVLDVGCQAVEGRASSASSSSSSSAQDISWSYASFSVMGGVLLVGVLVASAYVIYHQNKLHNFVQVMQQVAADLRRAVAEQQQQQQAAATAAFRASQQQQQAAPATLPIQLPSYVQGGTVPAGRTQTSMFL